MYDCRKCNGDIVNKATFVGALKSHPFAGLVSRVQKAKSVKKCVIESVEELNFNSVAAILLIGCKQNLRQKLQKWIKSLY